MPKAATTTPMWMRPIPRWHKSSVSLNSLKSTKNIALPLARQSKSFKINGREAQILSYSYDYLSRLSTSTFHNYSDAGVISGTNNYNENLSYDLRGNIQTLQRTGLYTNGSTCTYGQIDNPLAQVCCWNKSLTCSHYFRVYRRTSMHNGMRKELAKTTDDWHFFLGMVHAFASVDAGIMGAGRETMHQRCVWGICGKTWSSGVPGGH